MAALLCLGESTFRDYVRRKLLPEGILIGSSRRWKVETVSKALDQLQGAVPDDPVLRDMKGYLDGEKKKGRPRAA